MEKWKRIKDYPDYEVSTLGRIKSLKKNKEKILRTNISNNGYKYINLFNINQKSILVHQLVAIAFLGHVPNGKTIVVDHINFDRLDNRVENLRLITMRENTNLKHLESTSKYVGVGWHKRDKKWTSRIQINGKTKNLGYFDNEYNANLAYKKELQKLKA